MTDAFEFLARDHAEVQQLLTQLEIGAVRQGATTTDQLAQRKKLAEQLVIEESRHEAIEEMHFWPAVHEHLPNGNELADTAIAQEEEGKEILDKLDKLDAGTSRVRETAHRLRTRWTRAHRLRGDTRLAATPHRPNPGAGRRTRQQAGGRQERDRADPPAPAHPRQPGGAQATRTGRRRCR